MKSQLYNSQGYYFYQNKEGKLHNLYGPAFIWTDNNEMSQYFINNVKYSNFIEYIKAVINIKFNTNEK